MTFSRLLHRCRASVSPEGADDASATALASIQCSRSEGIGKPLLDAVRVEGAGLSEVG